jgi:hypothetical protein
MWRRQESYLRTLSGDDFGGCLEVRSVRVEPFVVADGNYFEHLGTETSLTNNLFRRFRKICEKRLLAPQVCLSVCSQGTTWLPLEGFS